MDAVSVPQSRAVYRYKCRNDYDPVVLKAGSQRDINAKVRGDDGWYLAVSADLWAPHGSLW